MAKLFLVLATIADLALAALLVSVSGFMFGGGPESTHAGALAAVGYVVAVIACLVAPVAGFGLGVTTAWVPVAGALTALVLPAPY